MLKRSYSALPSRFTARECNYHRAEIADVPLHALICYLYKRTGHHSCVLTRKYPAPKNANNRDYLSIQPRDHIMCIFEFLSAATVARAACINQRFRQLVLLYTRSNVDKFMKAEYYSYLQLAAKIVFFTDLQKMIFEKVRVKYPNYTFAPYFSPQVNAHQLVELTVHDGDLSTLTHFPRLQKLHCSGCMLRLITAPLVVDLVVTYDADQSQWRTFIKNKPIKRLTLYSPLNQDDLNYLETISSLEFIEIQVADDAGERIRAATAEEMMLYYNDDLDDSAGELYIDGALHCYRKRVVLPRIPMKLRLGCISAMLSEFVIELHVSARIVDITKCTNLRKYSTSWMRMSSSSILKGPNDGLFCCVQYHDRRRVKHMGTAYGIEMPRRPLYENIYRMVSDINLLDNVTIDEYDSPSTLVSRVYAHEIPHEKAIELLKDPVLRKLEIYTREVRNMDEEVLQSAVTSFHISHRLSPSYVKYDEFP